MSNKLWWAHLYSASPRYPAWFEILGSDEVPLQSPGSGRTKLGQESAEVYLLDLKQLTAEQRGRLVNWIHGKFSAPIPEIERELDQVGFPIRAEDVTVSFSLRAFL